MEVSTLPRRVEKYSVCFDEKDKKIESLEAEIAKNTFDNKQILKEAEAFFPEINSVSLANHTFYDENDSSFIKTVFIYSAEEDLNNSDQIKLENWLRQRLSVDSLEVFKE